MNNDIEIIIIKTPFIKLDSFLKYCGVAETGGIAKLMIADGLIRVNDEMCQIRGKKIYSGSRISVATENGLLKFEVKQE